MYIIQTGGKHEKNDQHMETKEKWRHSNEMEKEKSKTIIIDSTRMNMFVCSIPMRSYVGICLYKGIWGTYDGYIS
jgi:ligand-binding SRPBCC domain-containing protein